MLLDYIKENNPEADVVLVGPVAKSVSSGAMNVLNTVRNMLKSVFKK